MHPWHDLPNNPDTAHEGFNAIIEIPKGSKLKYELDKATGLLMLDRVLHSAVHYPANYGFFPQTHAGDGDPLDVLVLMGEPVHPLTIVRCRPIGGFAMRDDKGVDDKLLAVAVDDPSVSHYTDHAQLPPHMLRELRRFFEDYKSLENKAVEVSDMEGAVRAHEVLLEAFAFYRKEESKLRGWGS